MSVKTLYNPANLSKSELIESFVVRTKNFEKIFSDIRSSDMKYPEKHYLIQGQRGMGKTTLLLRLKYEVENSPELNRWVLPVFFGEESYDITSLSGLWEKSLDFLDDALNTNGIHFDHTEAFLDFEDYEKRCFDYLIEVLQKNKKKLIIFFDNFGQLFLENLKEKEKRRLREILMHCSEIRIIGASAIVLQDLHDYSEPFFEFFQIVRLDGLSKEETYHLIEKLQEKSEQKIDLKKAKGKIDTLAILTGGVIRTLMMVYQVLLEDQDGSALNDLETILDQITPLYKSRIEELPVQQRRIVDVIAKNWDAISAKEIAVQIREDGKRLQTKLVSAQLAQLEKNTVIEKKQTNTKNHLYQLKERFFNIWYLMRSGNKRDRKKVIWLTKFLEVWYDDEDGINAFLERHISHLRTGKYNPKSALLLAEALADFEKANPVKLDQIFDATSALLDNDQKSLLNIGQKKFALAVRSFNGGDRRRAIEILEGIKDKIHIHRLMLALFYLMSKSSEKVDDVLTPISDLDPSELEYLEYLCKRIESPDLLKSILKKSPRIGEGQSNFALGNLYTSLGDFSLAEKHYIESLNFDEQRSFQALSSLNLKRSNLEEAEGWLLKGLEKGFVEKKEVLEFYFFEYDGKVYDKMIQLLNELSPDDFFFNYFNGLAVLRLHEANSEFFLEARRYFELAILDFDRENIRSEEYLNVISNLFVFYLRVEKNKKGVTSLLGRLKYVDKIPPHLRNYQSFGMAWNGEFQSAIELMEMEGLLDEIYNDDAICEDYNKTILLLLAKNQNHLVFKLFSKIPKLKEILKPTYYALMTLLKDEYPNEVIKMGEELTQPVNDILKRIEEMKLEYA